MPERVWYLKRCDLFQQLNAAQLQILESKCRARKFPAGTPIYLPADQADAVLLLAEGRVKLGNFTEGGKQTIMAFIEPGEIFGELTLVNADDEDSQRDEYAETLVKSTVLLIPADTMRQLIEQNPHVSLGITKLFGLRRKRIERRLKYLLFRSNRERLVHLILELAEQYGRQTEIGVALEIRLSHQDLANIIGSTRETVTVVLGELQTERLLKLGRRKIVLTDISRLAEGVNVTLPPHLAPQP